MRQPIAEVLRPKNLDSYVFQNEAQEKSIRKIVSSGDLPNTMLVGKPGTGKTTLARILISEIDIHPSDLLTIDGSVNNKVAEITDLVGGHISVAPMGTMKVIHIEEMDRLTRDAQRALRVSMEEFSDQVRFIGSCNYINKIDPALISRFGVPYVFEEPSIEAVTETLGNSLCDAELMTSEESFENFQKHVNLYYPDMRQILASIDQSYDYEASEIGEPIEFKTFGAGIEEWIAAWSESSFNPEKILDLVGCVDSSNYNEVYETMYQNHGNFDDPASALVTIEEYLHKATTTENHVIVLTACVYSLFFLGE